jgi:hypothetical protein
MFDIIPDSFGVAKAEPWELGLSPFDRDALAKLELHVGLEISSKDVIMLSMEEEIFGELFETLDANFKQTDWANDHFTEALKFSPDRSKKDAVPLLKTQPKARPAGAKDKYSTRVFIHCPCLAFEMRKKSDEHIAELVLVDFRLEVDLFDHGLMEVSVRG